MLPDGRLLSKMLLVLLTFKLRCQVGFSRVHVCANDDVASMLMKCHLH